MDIEDKWEFHVHTSEESQGKLVQLVHMYPKKKKKKSKKTRSWLNIIYTLVAQCKNVIVQKRRKKKKEKMRKRMNTYKSLLNKSAKFSYGNFLKHL